MRFREIKQVLVYLCEGLCEMRKSFGEEEKKNISVLLILAVSCRCVGLPLCGAMSVVRY